MTSPLLTALATIGLALSTFVTDDAFAVSQPPQPLIADLNGEEVLRPGEYLWRAEDAIGPLLIVVSIPQQRLFLFQGQSIAGVSTVSTGKRGHRTPSGTFEILEKRRKHFSNLYDSAPMPFMQRLTWGGVALHAGHIPGYPASHGCIRLPKGFAKLLFGLTRIGGSVFVTDTPVDATAPLASWLPAEAAAALTMRTEPVLMPQLATNEPAAPAATAPGSAMSDIPMPAGSAALDGGIGGRSE
jgi:Uncharacterized protein conserved in bacteria